MKPVQAKATEVCQCGRKAVIVATRASDWKEVPHCPRCEMPCRMCECEDYQRDLARRK